ncbi:MAG: YopX family protein [Rickettsiales bacterium]|nr:YopX family protein [Rickettsiales bacterium]
MKIKFKGWDKQQNKMLGIDWAITAQGGFFNISEYTYEDDPIIMQFTGLIDKNGQEIYEGDLIKTPDNRILPVIFKEGCFGFENNLENKQFNCFTKALASAIEVVGNIHFN